MRPEFGNAAYTKVAINFIQDSAIITKQTTNVTEQKVNAGTRLGTMILDHIIRTSQSHMDNVLTKLEARIKEVGD